MTQKRVVVDATIARLVRTGSGVYVERLIPALADCLGGNLVTVTSRFAAPLGDRRTARDRLNTLARDLWWHQLGVTHAARRAGADLLHLPAGVGPVRGTLPMVVTVHDLIVLRSPEQFGPWFRYYAAAVMPRVARLARAVITGSETSKADIIEGLGVPSDRVFVTPYGVDPGFAPLGPEDGTGARIRRRYSLPDRFVLAVGAPEPRKNLPRLLEAIHRLRSHSGTEDVSLVHAGPGSSYSEAVRSTVESLRLHDAVRFLGYVPLEDLRGLYGLARLLVYPSLYEGFGLPVAEAMACGCPVITSRVSSLPEIAGDAAMLIDPQSPEDIACALERVWDDDTLHADLARRGLERARSFTWERTARETVAVYDKVLAG